MTILTDEERMNWLEWMAKKPNGILLHGETKSTNRLGIGLVQPDRTLRQAIDDCMHHDNEWRTRS